VVEEYHDAGISGAKGRKDRPGLDQMLQDAQRRRFDVVMAWAIDRLGRSLIDLLGTIQSLEACGVDLYLDQQSIDTTTPAECGVGSGTVQRVAREMRGGRPFDGGSLGAAA
jgi:DNA invertase Pin-like site-specific DNA recombinase